MLMSSIFGNDFMNDFFGGFPYKSNGTMQTDVSETDGKYIRKERYSGSCSRSFYVGDAVTQDDVKAKFENGVLTLEVPKKEEAPKVEEKKYISIEG